MRVTAAAVRLLLSVRVVGSGGHAVPLLLAVLGAAESTAVVVSPAAGAAAEATAAATATAASRAVVGCLVNADGASVEPREEVLAV